MKKLWLLIGLLLGSYSARAELQINVDPAILSEYIWIYYPEEYLVRARIATLDASFEAWAEAVLGPAQGVPAMCHAVIRADSLFPQQAMVLELELVVVCEFGQSAARLEYDPLTFIYTAGPPQPPAGPTPFPLTLFNVCPPTLPDLPRSRFMGQEYASYHGYYYCGWNDALQVARVTGGRLAEIESEAENLFLAELAYFTPAWIGLSDSLEEGVWRWTSGEIAQYTNWAPGQPVDSPAHWDYVYMDGNGLWFTTGPEYNDIEQWNTVLLEWTPLIMDLGIRLEAHQLVLEWTAPAGGYENAHFVIHHSEQPWFSPDESTRIGVTQESSYSIALSDLPDGRGWFKVKVEPNEAE